MRANSSVEVAMDDENSFLSEWQNFSGKLGFNSRSVTDTPDDMKLIGNNDFFMVWVAFCPRVNAKTVIYELNLAPLNMLLLTFKNCFYQQKNRWSSDQI